MQEIVFQGLKIATPCRYIKFTLGKYIEIKEDYDKSLFELIFPADFKSTDIIDSRIKLVSKKPLIETNHIKIETPIINLNGLKLKRIVQRDYNYSQIIVDNIEEFTMDYKEDRCTVLIPQKLDYDVEMYISLLKYNPFLEIVDYSELVTLNNFYNINFTKRSVSINSKNNFSFNTKKKYSKYLLDMFNVLASFLRQFKALLKDYGIEMVKFPISDDIRGNNYIAYRVTELGTQMSRHTADEETLRYAVQHKSTIEFHVSFPDLKILTDFSNKYQNLDLITNFTTFYTKDKLGVDWKSSIWWSPLKVDFIQEFETDTVGNYAQKASFTAELNYFVVHDELFYTINEMILDVVGYGSNDIDDLQEPFLKKLK